MTLLEQVLVSIITALLTAGLAYFGFWRQAKAELMKEYQMRFNEKKWNIYLGFVDLIPMLRELNRLSNKHNIQLQKKQKIMTDEEELRGKQLSKEYIEKEEQIENQILLISSVDVICTFFQWKLKADIYDANDEETINLQVKLLNYMRKDLGIEKSDLSTNILDGSYFYSHKFIKELVDELRELNK